MKVWHYETGQRLQSIDLNQLVILDDSNLDTEKVTHKCSNYHETLAYILEVLILILHCMIVTKTIPKCKNLKSRQSKFIPTRQVLYYSIIHMISVPFTSKNEKKPERVPIDNVCLLTNTFSCV